MSEKSIIPSSSLRDITLSDEDFQTSIMMTALLVTGSESGIGKDHLRAYARRPNTTVVAAIRECADSPAAVNLTSLPGGCD